MLPMAFMEYVAQIALIWGTFENGFERFLLTLLSANGTDPNIARGFSFERKAELLRRGAKTLFSDRPFVLLHILALIDDAKRAQLERNLLLHGSLVIEVKTKDDPALPPDVTIIAHGRRKKQDIYRRFTLEKVEDLYCDLAHLGGRIGEFLTPSQAFLLHVAWQDRCFLLDLLKKHRQIHQPTPGMVEGQPAPFRT